ncbi:MAG: hypothetical protein RL662_1090 [Bacteroidota bacterium]|jgi:phenylalanyl-tRNA synthetase beta chain
MNISYNWLKEYINTDLSPVEISEVLTSIGLETGGVEEIQTIKGGLEGLVVGEVLTCLDHPNSDHLHITTINVGAETPLQIVCGAKNVAAGQKVIVALIGTTLYTGEEEFTIKKSKIRGEESFGMICAEDEIGIGTSHDGIIVLPQDAIVGTLAKDYYNVKSEYVLEVDITPNRVDAASHVGVARDLAAYLKQNGTEPVLTYPSIESFNTDTSQQGIKVIVENSEACPRYSGITVKGITVKESPDWLKNKLLLIGLRPINNVVDVTNYVLYELGHPLHAFDMDQIVGETVFVKTVADETKFTTLDEVERTLSDKDLMICNNKEGMCIGGVFGGAQSGVTKVTTNIFLECAYFNPTWVRKTARRHGLNTDSSFRFERGVDPNDTIYVLKRAALLIQELAGGTFIGDIQDIYPVKIEQPIVELPYSKVNTLIGKYLQKETVKSILKSLEIEILQESDDILSLAIPTYRVDVLRDVDVIEDILRIYGYNNIEISNDLKSNLSYQTDTDKSNDLQNLISEQLTGEGFFEIMNNSLTKELYYNNLDAYPARNCVKLLNPLSGDLNVMRQTLLFGGLESIAYNRNRKYTDLKFYELGNCYFFDTEKKDENKPLKEYSEELHLALWLCGDHINNSWATPAEKTSVYLLKGYVEKILVRVGLTTSLVYEPFRNDIYSTALTIKTRNRTIGTLGIVSKKILKQADINTDVYFAELNWDNIMKETKKHNVNFVEISKYPAVKRDLALLLDKNILFEEVEKIAYKSEKKLLKGVSLFDVYEGKNVPEGKKSYAVNFVLQDIEKTLTDKQIDDSMKKIQAALEKDLNAQLR